MSCWIFLVLDFSRVVAKQSSRFPQDVNGVLDLSVRFICIHMSIRAFVKHEHVDAIRKETHGTIIDVILKFFHHTFGT